jgi:drug/metabolite transporter (DMT)-like permease
VITGTGVDPSGTAFRGDLLALAGAIGGAVYTAFGEHARATISTTSYTAICYPVCALALLVLCLAAGVPLAGFPATAWLVLVGLTVGPQLLGHSLFNFSLRRVSATTVSVVVLLEVPGAALIGWLWLGQTVRPAVWPGLAMLMAGVVIVVLGTRRSMITGRAGGGRWP